MKDADGNSYSTVVIGEQEWMQSNLNVRHFNNGDEIPLYLDMGSFFSASRKGKPAMTYYNFDTSYGQTLGALYNYYALSDKRGIVPEGWVVPSTKDFEDLMTFLGPDVGSSLKAQKGWTEKEEANNGNGNNRSGFSALPSASVIKVFRGGPDDAFTQSSGLWTSNGPFSLFGLRYGFAIYANDQVHVLKASKRTGLAIRLLKK